MLSLSMAAPFLGGGAPGRLAGPGSLQFKVRASGGTFVPEWCAPGACRGCDCPSRRGTCLWSVPEVVVGRKRHDWAELEKTAKKMNESGQEFAASVGSAEDIDRFQTLDTGARRAIAITFSTLPLPVEPVSVRIAAGCLERAGAARHCERHHGLLALGAVVHRDTRLRGA